MKLQEHEYKARDKTVQKMSRDGLREENLHNKEEKRITSRDEDIEVSRNPKKEEDFGKNRRERITENKDIPTRKKPSDITRYSIDEEQKVKLGRYVLPFGLSLLCITPGVTWLSLQFSTTLLVALAAMAVLLWKPQWTAENLDREKWSEITQKEKNGRKRRLPDNKKLRKKKISVIVKHLRLQKNHWKDFRMRSKVR